MEDKFRIAVTTMVFNHKGEILLTKRKSTKKRWPSKWTFPGGHVETSDYIGKPTDINNQWYHTLEHAAQREVKEETGLSINLGSIKYLCNIAIPDCFIISYTGKYVHHDFDEAVKLQSEECDEFVWVLPEEALTYDLIDGLADEIRLARYI